MVGLQLGSLDVCRVPTRPLSGHLPSIVQSLGDLLDQVDHHRRGHSRIGLVEIETTTVRDHRLDRMSDCASRH